jgi:hypothetical protein
MQDMNDQQIKALFESQKKEIPDDDFSRRVMAFLPRRSSVWPQIIVALFSLAGIATVVAIIGIKQIVEFLEGISSLSGPDMLDTMVYAYLFIVGAMTMIGLSIKAAAD